MKFLGLVLAALVLGLLGFGYLADSQADLEMAKALKYQSQAALVDKSMDAALMAIMTVLVVGMLVLGGLALFYRSKAETGSLKPERKLMLPRAERAPQLGVGVGSTIEQLVQLQILREMRELRKEEIEKL